MYVMGILKDDRRRVLTARNGECGSAGVAPRAKGSARGGDRQLLSQILVVKMSWSFATAAFAADALQS